MPEQPKLELNFTTAQKVVEITSWVVLIIMWLMVLSHFTKLAAIIPIHHNATGQIDATGSRNFVFVLPAIATILMVGLSFLSRFPHNFNYPRPVTPQNAYRQYSNAIMLIRVIKLIICIVFTLISAIIIRDALGLPTPGTLWVFPLILTLSVVPLIIFYGQKWAKEKM